MRHQSDFLEKRWEGALPILALQKQHIFQRASPHHLYVGRYASQQPRHKIQVVSCEHPDIEDNEQQVLQSQMPATKFQLGDWVLVRYDQHSFPGEVKVVGQDEMKVSVMVPSGSLFKWPLVEDAIFYRHENVIMKLNPPTLKSARGAYKFDEKW